MRFFCLLLLIYISVTQSSIYVNVEQALKNLADTEKRKPQEARKSKTFNFIQRSGDNDALQAQLKAKVLERVRRNEDRLNNGKDIPSSKLSVNSLRGDKEYYHMDPVLNQLSRRNNYPLFRIRVMRRDDKSDTSSTSLEMRDWKDEFKDYYMQKKFEAINSTDMRGDVVNMAAARPWGVPCGDPHQHDMPWGNCMMSAECEAEYRIYRGDLFCGRTQFICCALQITNYDLYQGFDVSFADSSFSTDSAEKRFVQKGSTENKNKHKRHARKKRDKDRRKRKKKIKKNIKNIVKEIRKILNRAYRNSSRHRSQRTKLLKKYIKVLKKQYKKDRKSIRDIHAVDVDKIDEALEIRLKQVSELNRNFIMNSTFRDIVVNGTISRSGARMLAEAYPELTEYLPAKWLRRDGGGEASYSDEKTDDYLEYDIEYGALYY